MRVKNVYFCCH